MAKAIKKKKQKLDTYLINVTVLEGRHYAWENMNSFVHVKIRNKAAITKTRYGTDAPFYNEYFVFEFKMSLHQLLDQHITLTVYRAHACCKLKKILGYITLDLETIWEEEDHQFYRKWAILNSPKADFAGPVGYLKVIISILGEGAVPKIPMVNPLDDNEIDGNLLLPEGTTERKKALYVFKFYRGYDILKKKRGTAVIEEELPETEEKPSELPNTRIRVTFAGITGKTAIKKHSCYPIWNESLTISELYPPLSQRIRIDLLYTYKGSKNMESKRNIHLYSICNYKSKEFLPTFGPAFLHFYKANAMGEEYVGKILMAMETKVFSDLQTKTRCTFIDEIPPVFDSNLWEQENIFLFASIANVSVIDKRYKDSISFELNWGRMKIIKNEFSDTLIPHVLTPTYKAKTTNKKFWYLDFQQTIPCMHIINNYPKLRRRYFRQNHMDKIIANLSERLKSIRELFKSEIFVTYSHLIEDQLQEYFDYVIAACTKFVDMIKNVDKLYQTELDIRKDKHAIEEFQDIVKLSKNAYNPRMKKKSFRKAEGFYLRILKLFDYPQECWPDICLWIRNSNHKTECLRFEPRDLLHSEIPEEKGKYSGRLNNFYFMTKKHSTSLSPVVCKIELFIWLGLEREKEECFKLIPSGFKIPESSEKPEVPKTTAEGEENTAEGEENTAEGEKKPEEVTKYAFDIVTEIPKQLKLDDFLIFNGRVHIYQGRFALAFDYTGLADFFVRVIIHDQSKQTRAPKQTLSPIWDETLIFKNIVCYGTKEHIASQPPPIVLEVNDKDRWSLEYVGFCLITPLIKFKDDTYSAPKFPPKLEWQQIKADDLDVGEVLACVEFLEVTDNEEENEKFYTDKVTISIPEDIRPVMINYRFEVMFWGVRHLKKLKHLPIKSPKLIIECNEYKIETEIADIARINFSKNSFILDMQLPNIPSFIPPIMIKLYECKSFNRCKYAGTHLSFIQEFFYTPITLNEFKSKLKEPIRTSLDTLPSKTESDLEEHMEKLRKAKKRKDRRRYILWRIRLVCSASNFRGIGKMCCMSTCRGIKKTLRFLCCLLLCCGCGRMCKKKKKKKVEGDGSPPKFFRTKEMVIDMENKPNEEEVKDWWSKYFNSLVDPYTQLDIVFDKNFTIKIYDNELEKQKQFSQFEDVMNEYRIYRGKTTGDVNEDEKSQIGTAKCKIVTYEWNDDPNMENFVTPQGTLLKEGYFQKIPSNYETRFLVRIYCIRGIQLRPTDSSGSCDSFLVIRMKQQVIDDKKNYVPKSTNPFYGRCYEFEGTFPIDNTISVAIYDFDRSTKTDLIGQTKIDIENRFYSKHRASCGLPMEYILSGETPWRDIKEPTEILENLCERNNLPSPEYKEGNVVLIADKKFTLPKNKERENEPEFVKKEMLALFVLQKWHDVPILGYHLVPEHVETRSLYHPDTPGLEQGKLQMWIDIFPILDTPIPYQVNIRTRAPVTYELRVIIWNTDKVLLNEDDFFGGRKSDIYVKGWVTNPGDSQETDVHYRSMTGEGNFNWRFVFVFDYLSAENMIVEKKKQHVFDIDETERKLPCRLTLQVWDNDIFSKDDFIGSLTLYLNRMPRGAKVARQCNVKNFEGAPRFNLFKVKRTRGWWPFLGKDKTNHMKSIVAGKVEAEFELVTTEQATQNPVGLGRNAPQPLPPPKRPSTSFNWIFNPWKTFRYILWGGLKWKLLICLIVVLGALFLGLFLYSVPGYSVKKLLNV